MIDIASGTCLTGTSSMVCHYSLLCGDTAAGEMTTELKC